MNQPFNLNEALEQIKTGAKINGKDGKSTKTMKSSVSEFELDVPRDRNGSYEPQLVKKHQTHISDNIEQKILSLYALGNSYSQISEHIEEIYGMSFSKATISAVTDKVIPF